jgi:hypothetical protein
MLTRRSALGSLLALPLLPLLGRGALADSPEVEARPGTTLKDLDALLPQVQAEASARELEEMNRVFAEILETMTPEVMDHRFPEFFLGPKTFDSLLYALMRAGGQRIDSTKGLVVYAFGGRHGMLSWDTNHQVLLWNDPKIHYPYEVNRSLWMKEGEAVFMEPFHMDQEIRGDDPGWRILPETADRIRKGGWEV